MLVYPYIQFKKQILDNLFRSENKVIKMEFFLGHSYCLWPGFSKTPWLVSVNIFKEIFYSWFSPKNQDYLCFSVLGKALHLSLIAALIYHWNNLFTQSWRDREKMSFNNWLFNFPEKSVMFILWIIYFVFFFSFRLNKF